LWFDLGVGVHTSPLVWIWGVKLDFLELKICSFIQKSNMVKRSLLVALIAILFCSSLAAYCTGRGGCSCDCSWTQQHPCSSAQDDGSCCFNCCCPSGGDPTTSPPSPSGKTAYCPSSNDLIVAYGNAQLFDQGWSVHGGGAAATKTAFNLLGGYVEFDIDFSNTRTGVNANIYTISPSGIGSGGFNNGQYCDAQKSGGGFCMEVDWVESNGNCGGQSTLHVHQGPGSGCTAWGCATTFHYNGRSAYHMKVMFGEDGQWSMVRDGQTIHSGDFNPSVPSGDWGIVANTLRNQGAVIYSSEWTGWVPLNDCGSYGDLGSSSFTVKNLRVVGSVAQGPEPRKCSNGFNSTILIQ
jgi:hypothetical protein